MTDPREQAIRDIEARLDAATPGPWEAGATMHAEPFVHVPGRPLRRIATPNYGNDDYGKADVDLIAHAPADIRLLLDMVAEQREEVERLRAPFAERERIEALIEASSLGTSEAKAVRDSVPNEVGIAIARAAKYLGDLRAMTFERDNERAARDLLAETVADYERSIDWDTTCTNCGRLMGQCYTETVRAEDAEARATAAEGALGALVERGRGLAEEYEAVKPSSPRWQSVANNIRSILPDSASADADDDVGCGWCGEPMHADYTGSAAYHLPCAVEVYGDEFVLLPAPTDTTGDE